MPEIETKNDPSRVQIVPFTDENEDDVAAETEALLKELRDHLPKDPVAVFTTWRQTCRPGTMPAPTSILGVEN